MPLSNEELSALIQKATITTATGGMLSAQQTDEFLNLVVDQAPIMQQMRVETGIAKSLDVDGLEFGESIIIAGTEGTAPAAADVVVPSMPRLTITPKEIVAAVDISYSWLRSNIKRETAEQDVNAAIAKRIGMDLLDVIFNGDTANAGTGRRDKALKILDGLIKKANADAAVHDDVIAASPTWGGSAGELSAQLKLLPKQYRDDRNALVHLLSQADLDDFEDEVADRQTVAGDAVLFGNNVVSKHKRVALLAPYMFPDGKVITTNKRNIVVGFGREMQFYKENNHRARKLEITVVIDMDCGYVFGDALVLGQKA